MKTWLRGKPGGLAAFLLIAGLVAGGLGWATAAVLRLEREREVQRAEAELANHLAVALWRLDSHTAPLMAREDGRPFDHYGAVHSPPLVYNRATNCWEFGTTLELSPLLSASVDGWMLLHFQVDARGWKSPQVLEPDVRRLLTSPRTQGLFLNATPERADLLARLGRVLPPADVLAAARGAAGDIEGSNATLFLANNANNRRNFGNNDLSNDLQNTTQPNGGVQNPNWINPLNQAAIANGLTLPNGPPVFNQFAQREGQKRVQQFGRGNETVQEDRTNQEQAPRDMARNTVIGDNKKLLDPKLNPARGTEVVVKRTPLVPLWLKGADGADLLLALRLVRVEDIEVCQGVLLDVGRLGDELAELVGDLFPDGKLVPVRDGDEASLDRTMTSLPFRLDPGPLALPAEPGWTPLRVGLTVAWGAALVALLAVGLGGWSLLDLSERRIRFVSAVTHELRTPLTTLRLYLDMLLGGLVRDEKQRREYLETLHGEADRLTRLVGNVLDFSRLEKQHPRLNRTRVDVRALLDGLAETWRARCRAGEKELVVECALEDGAALETDAELLQQVLGNLIDNACKYSAGADDRRVWLRARREDGQIVFAVEDRGPGVPRGERRSIFRPFRRGRAADSTSGGVGLGLALARNWAKLLGGKLRLAPPAAEGGACFEVALAGLPARLDS